jgi:tetratricopeptide (TPR) repeat protein
MKRIAAIILFVISITCPIPAMDGEDPVQLVQRGEAKHEKKDYAGAIADYSRAIRLNPREGDWYFKRALSKTILKDWDGNIADATRAIELIPDHSGAYAIRGVARREKRDFDGAIEDYMAARKLKADIIDDSELASAYFKRATAPGAGKNPKLVLDDMQRARELDPKVMEKNGWVTRKATPEEAKVLGRPQPQSNGDPDLRVVLLQPGDIQDWPKEKLRSAINWLYAHHGLVFVDKQIDAAFRKTDWYKPNPRLTAEMIEEQQFTETEKANIKLLGEARERAEK